MAKAKVDTKHVAKEGSPLKLFIGAFGIFGAFSYYGYLMDPIVKFETDSDENFGKKYAWFLQLMEAGANVLVGGAGILATQGGQVSPGLPFSDFGLTGASQVMSKAMFTLAQGYGLPFFLATLVKNAKMLPVMVGSIITTKKMPAARKWAQVGLIIAGCVLVTVGKKAKAAKAKNDTAASPEGSSSEFLGFLCLAISLVGDGFTGGRQKGMQKAYEEKHPKKKLQPYELMTFTNSGMMLVALGVSLARGEFFDGLTFLSKHYSELLPMVVKFSFCSAIGQSAIFFTMANFDSLTVTTVTTTRKIFSVLLGIFQNGKPLEPMQWCGVGVASLGVLGELQEKFGDKEKKHVK